MPSKVLRRVCVGTVSVDSGQVLIVDPGYLLESHKMDEALYDHIFDVKIKNRNSGAHVENQAAPCINNLAVTAFSGLGDGTYEVYATIVDEGPSWGERISKLEIIFLPDDDDDDEEFDEETQEAH